MSVNCNLDSLLLCVFTFDRAYNSQEVLIEANGACTGLNSTMTSLSSLVNVEIVIAWSFSNDKVERNVESFLIVNLVNLVAHFVILSTAESAYKHDGIELRAMDSSFLVLTSNDVTMNSELVSCFVLSKL